MISVTEDFTHSVWVWRRCPMVNGDVLNVNLLVLSLCYTCKSPGVIVAADRHASITAIIVTSK